MRAERFLEGVSDRYGLVLALVLLTYVLASALPNTAWAQVLLVASSTVTVMATLAASGTPLRRRQLAGLIGVAAVVIAVITALVGGRTGGLPGAITSIQLAGCLVAIIRRIAKHDHVSSQTVLGAMCCYVLFGLVYTFIYEATARLQGFPILTPGSDHSLSDYLFFSFSTLTTTGYGNLVPATGVGRTLATLEALMGQLFLVTVVARLVALWAPRRTRAVKARDGAPAAARDRDQ